MHIMNIATSPRKEQSASRALVDTFLREYMTQAGNIAVDMSDVWQECLPEFDAKTMNAKYKGVSGEPMIPTEIVAWKKIRELASRFQRADCIVMGVPMWNFSFPYKLKQLIDLSCQRNSCLRSTASATAPRLTSRRAFVAFVRGQNDEAGFDTVSQPGFQYLSGYVEFWLRFIGVREVVTLARTYVGWPRGGYDRFRQKEGRRTGNAILTKGSGSDARLWPVATKISARPCVGD